MMDSTMKEFKHLIIQLEDIRETTNSFRNETIGSGGFGPVYKGELTHSKGRSLVAIKRLNSKYGQGNTEFRKEIMMLSRYTHQNLIPLLGFCDEGGEKILVYEFAFNGSLDIHLGSTVLTWKQRIKICLDAARGLRYLHDDKGTQQRVLHRDIKSSNILLDENWNAKVSDMGLSKLGPANQEHTTQFTNVVGTLGYIDPMYLQMGFLTKQSDVYSFGVVLVEVLCGRLCFEKSESGSQNLVYLWKQSYTNKNLEQKIFQNLPKHIDPKSLEIFSDIAFQCLHDSREDRPDMSLVVEKLESALEYQEPRDRNLPKEYEEILMAAVPPLEYLSVEELKRHLSKGVHLNEGKTWLLLNMKGERCEMISIAQCFIPVTSTKSRYLSSYNSRFDVGCYEPSERTLETHVRTQFLSTQITYFVNLVFKNKDIKERCIGLEYILKGGTTCYAFLSDEREDGWLTAELFQFTSDQKIIDLNILFDMQYCRKLLLEGIEFQPLENEEHEVVQASDTDWKEKPETDYEDGETYLMLPTRAALEEKRWMSLPKTRFEDVGHGSSRKFVICCEIESKKLPRETTYATYLIYEQKSNYRAQPPPAQVKDINSNFESHIYFDTPKTPVIIRGKVDDKTYNPSRRIKINGLPKQRSNGWMEVQVWQFNTGTTTQMIPMNLKLSSYDKALEGILVYGIEFKPI